MVFTVPRRTLLGGLAAAGLTAPLGSLAFAAGPAQRKLVLVILRGAMDGLAAVPPLGDPHYARLRGDLALPSDGEGAAARLTDVFGLHPSLSFLRARWAAGELAILHAAASAYRERSHFDGQDVLESGAAAVFAARDGWLNRALTALPPESRVSGVAIANAMPLVLRGPGSASTWAPSFAPEADDDTLTRLMDLYAGDTLLGPLLAQAIQTDALAQGAGMAQSDPSAGAARGRFGAGAYQMLAQAASRLLAAPDGPATAVLSFEGWDTHANQGAATGQLAARFQGLDAALRALHDGLGPLWAQTVVVVATEFGRTVAQNGARGTDHGTGGAAFVLGGAVRGGRMLGDWPGLAPQALYEGRDLAPANDLRGLFASVLESHWGLEPRVVAQQVFPNAGVLRREAGLLRG
jgi:uncharacterized protein (DUF1501 family)